MHGVVVKVWIAALVGLVLVVAAVPSRTEAFLAPDFASTLEEPRSRW
jgi:hypothetical protein